MNPERIVQPDGGTEIVRKEAIQSGTVHHFDKEGTPRPGAFRCQERAPVHEMRVECAAIGFVRGRDIIRHGVNAGRRRTMNEKPRMVGRALEDKLRPSEFKPERHYHDLGKDALDREGLVLGKGVGSVRVVEFNDMDGTYNSLRDLGVEHRPARSKTIILEVNEFPVTLHDGDALSLAVQPV